MVSMETNPERRHDREAPVSSLERHIGYWLRRVSNHVSGSFARGLNTRHTSVAEWVALCMLHARQGTTPAELADTLGLTRGAVSKILDKLEGKKWITRKAKPQDSRVQLLAMTRQARRILPQLAEIADQNDQQAFGSLAAEERTTLRRLLQKIADSHHLRDVPIE